MEYKNIRRVKETFKRGKYDKYCRCSLLCKIPGVITSTLYLSQYKIYQEII